jgi:glycosyltransferase involved in cell wall biosynthesis
MENSNMLSPQIWIAIPCLNELEYIVDTIECIQNQTYPNYNVVVCVNQAESYHSNTEYSHIVENNLQTIQLLKDKQEKMNIHILDKSSKGQGWVEKNQGVGWARKLLFDTILQNASPSDIIISMDADTVFPKSYFQSVIDIFQKHTLGIALSVPYYHHLSGDEELDRLMLRYELYMRYYALNLWRIASPYSFTALGSAIAFPVSSYIKMRGITAKISGEDFYLLQKLRKNGRVLHWIKDSVYPATRYSDRVIFGTGPALLKGKSGNWSTYPFYHITSFNKLQIVFQNLEILFQRDIPLPIDSFIEDVFKVTPKEFWLHLRLNNKDTIRFIHAFHSKFDGLKTLQFLRYDYPHEKNIVPEERILLQYINNFHPSLSQKLPQEHDFSFQHSSIPVIDALRKIFADIENAYRIEDNNSNQILQSKKHISRWKYLGL